MTSLGQKIKGEMTIFISKDNYIVKIHCGASITDEKIRKDDLVKIRKNKATHHYTTSS